jgi:asparagine synthase (glutamine-hydrolysing)
MAILAGIIVTGTSDASERHCRRSLTVQRKFADDSEIHIERAPLAVLGGSRGAVARHLRHSDPRFSLIADIRFDNRAEVVTAIGLATGEQAQLTDADLLLVAWSRWQAAMLERIAGSFAIAVHDRVDGSTFLIRDAFGERPLNYSIRQERLSFSSMPSGVWPDEALSPDIEVLAKQYRDCLLPPDQSNFHGIVRVAPGHIVEFTDGSARARRYWRPTPPSLPRTHGELVAAFRSVFDQAVAARLSSRSTPNSSMLSSGFDSSSVTGTAAHLLDRPDLLTAFTSAPSYDKLLLPVSRFADETPIASASARMLRIRHQIVRDRTPILGSIRGMAQFFEAPAPNPVNFAWWRKIMDEVRGLGQSSVLVAVEGNFTISYGGTFVLPVYLKQRRLLKWLRETRDTVQTHTYLRWRGALFSSFEPLLPQFAVRGLQWLFNRRPGTERPDLDFLNPAFSDPWHELGVMTSGDLIDDRLLLLSLHDNGERYKGMTALTGIDERDPTADRRLVEFCLALRPEHLLYRGEPRPLAREAFSDRINPQVFDFAVRGHQSADWYCRLLQSEALEMLDEIRTTSAADLLNIPKLEASISQWPAFDPKAYWTLMPWGRNVWQALNMGLFLAETERNGRPA